MQSMFGGKQLIGIWFGLVFYYVVTGATDIPLNCWWLMVSHSKNIKHFADKKNLKFTTFTISFWNYYFLCSQNIIINCESIITLWICIFTNNINFIFRVQFTLFLHIYIRKLLSNPKMKIPKLMSTTTVRQELV